MPTMKTTKSAVPALALAMTLLITASSSAVVGGVAATAGTWPSVAFVADTQNDVACTGTVISPLIVLTAAHCVEDVTTGALAPASAFQVVTGRLNWTDPSSGQLLDVARVIVNPGYTLTTFGTDAALLVLAAPTAAPAIALATPADSAMLDSGTVAAIAGWGQVSGGTSAPPAALQWGTTVVQSSTYCTSADASDEVAFDPTADICTIDTPSETTAACHGDSGGPLVVSTSAGPIEIGLTSRGDAGCAPSEPTTYTAAQAISGWAADWIAQYPSAAVNAPAAPVGTPSVAAQAKQGEYASRGLRHGDAVSFAVAPGGASITRLTLRFVLRCAHAGPRGTYVRTVERARPLTLSDGFGVDLWSFTSRYADARHWHYSVSGQLRANGTASGTLTVTTPHSRCTTGRVAWTAGVSAPA